MITAAIDRAAALADRARSAWGVLTGPPGGEPGLPRVPQVDEAGRTNVPGLFVVGDAAGTPLLKLGMNAGARCADVIAGELSTAAPAPAGGASDVADRVVDLIVVGAGAAGLACALRARKRGLSVRVLEGQALAQTVESMTHGKHIFAEPHSTPNTSDLWLAETTREELLTRWRAAVVEARLDLRTHEPVVGVTRRGQIFEVKTRAAAHQARRVVVAVGKAGSPRRAGVPGERAHARKLRHALDDASAVRGQHVLIYGGGDVACEAGLALSPHNTVTLVTVDAALTYPKKRNRDAIQAAQARGELTVHLGARLIDFDATTIRFSDSAAREHALPNDLVFEMIGAEPPVALFRKLGLTLEGQWDRRRYAAALLVFLGVYCLYALKKFPEQPHAWPFSELIDAGSFGRAVGALFGLAFAPFAWLFTEAARADIARTLWFQQGYLYSLAYTLVMLAFGWRALTRWTRVARNPRHQRWRYASLLAFQVVFFLAANVVAVQALSVQHSWRAWGLYQPWPLFFHTYHWWQASDPAVVKWGFIGAGLVGTFVAIPLLSYKHGKRFCTWVCGCGGLAETLGDRWRHLAPKGRRSRAWEFQGFVVLLAALIVTVVTVGMYQTRADNPWALAYSYVVDFWLVAVIPMALYPFFGGKIWCRYWCPLAAWNQLLARLYGRLGIESNDTCISCGQCSKHCQVGVEVMQFARAQERFDNTNSSCIHCGICIDVCPVQVLSFSTRPRAAGRSLPIVQ